MRAPLNGVATSPLLRSGCHPAAPQQSVRACPTCRVRYRTRCYRAWCGFRGAVVTVIVELSGDGRWFQPHLDVAQQVRRRDDSVPTDSLRVLSDVGKDRRNVIKMCVGVDTARDRQPYEFEWRGCHEAMIFVHCAQVERSQLRAADPRRQDRAGRPGSGRGTALMPNAAGAGRH